MVALGQFGERGVVSFDIFEAHGAGVAGDVVGAGEDDDDFGLQGDYVLAEADQHLRGGLASDAAVEVGLAGEIFVEVPDVGDGIAEEYDAVLAGRGRLEGSVGVAVAGELSEIVGENGDARGPVLVEAGESGGRDGGRCGLRRGLSQQTQWRKSEKQCGYRLCDDAERPDVHVRTSRKLNNEFESRPL